MSKWAAWTPVIAVLVGVGIVALMMKTCYEDIQDTITVVNTDTLYVSDTLIQTVIERGKGEVSFIERFTEREVLPDTVYIGMPADSGANWDAVPLDFGTTEVLKQGRSLRVSRLSLLERRAEVLHFSLSAEDSDYRLAPSDSTPRLRETRKLTLLAIEGQISGVYGSSGGLVIVQGPVSVGSRHVRAMPAVVADKNGLSYGGSLNFRF